MPPLEEALFPPALVLVLALGGPLLAHRALRRWPGHRFGLIWASLGSSLAAAFLAHDALGPRFAPEPGWSLPSAIAIFVAVTLPLGLGLRLSMSGRGRALGPSTAGVLLGTALVASVATSLHATRIENAADASAAQARWRLRLRPWDATAMLALAWDARRRGALDRAAERVDRAEGMGAPPADTWELRTEIAALRGDCEEARAAFDAALRARAEAAMQDALETDLSLGDYRLPQTLITRCGLTP